jgi:hypothetical protein
VCTALQAVASPLGHSTTWVDAYRTFERMTGFEPATPTLARLCATNCATSACYGRDRRPLRRTTLVESGAATQIPGDRRTLGTHRGRPKQPSVSTTWQVSHCRIGKVLPAQTTEVRHEPAASCPGRSRRQMDVNSREPATVHRARVSAEMLVRCGSDRLIQDRRTMPGSLRPRSAGPVAQWESVRFTRGRSLVRSQPGPLSKGLLQPLD